MKKFVFLLFGVLFSNGLFAQSTLSFEYDVSGNQIYRGPELQNIMAASVDSTSVSKNMEADQKLLSENESELIKITAAPNPVSDELQINWENVEDHFVIGMGLFNYQNQKLLQLNIPRNQNVRRLNFRSYPQGIYFLIFTTSRNQTQTYKIIKN